MKKNTLKASINKFLSNYEVSDIVVIISFIILIFIEVFFITKNQKILIYFIENIVLVAGSLTLFYYLSVKKISPWISSVLRMAFVVLPALFFFKQLGDLIPLVNPFRGEHLLLEIDYKLLGTNPSAFLEAYHNPWLTEILQIIYTSFYFLPLFLGLTLYFSKQFKKLNILILGIELAFYSSYFLYFTIPAKSPYRLLKEKEVLKKVKLDYKKHDFKGIFFTKRLREWIDKTEPNQFDCFPSGHTEVSVTLLILSFILYRKTFYFYLPIVSLLVFSTVYLKYHYLIDVIAGLTLAAIVVPSTLKLYDWWEKNIKSQKKQTST